jgi:hypothetical protein
MRQYWHQQCMPPNNSSRSGQHSGVAGTIVIGLWSGDLALIKLLHYLCRFSSVRGFKGFKRIFANKKQKICVNPRTISSLVVKVQT